MFEPYTYGLGLLVSLGCLTFIDYKYKLAFFFNHKRALRTIIGSMIVFIAWDIVGIWQRLFYTGDSRVISKLFIISNFPVEELVFLALLAYSTLLIWRYTERFKK